VFHLTVNYAFTMLKWTACENLPADLDSCEAAAAAADADARYVTMLFNDETHTYDQVDTSSMFTISVTMRRAYVLCVVWTTSIFIFQRVFWFLSILPLAAKDSI